MCVRKRERWGEGDRERQGDRQRDKEREIHSFKRVFSNLSVLEPLQGGHGDGLSFTLQRQGVVDLQLDLLRNQPLPWHVVLIDLGWNYGRREARRVT